MPPSVLLLHRLPDGSSHYDWMIQRLGGPAAPLLTFRVEVRIDTPPVAPFRGVRLGDHRAAYLTYEGPVSAGRGEVVRVAAGSIEVIEETADRLVLAGGLGAASGTFTGAREPGDGECWGFVVSPNAPGGA